MTSITQIACNSSAPSNLQQWVFTLGGILPLPMAFVVWWQSSKLPFMSVTTVGQQEKIPNTVRIHTSILFHIFSESFGRSPTHSYTHPLMHACCSNGLHLHRWPAFCNLLEIIIDSLLSCISRCMGDDIDVPICWEYVHSLQPLCLLCTVCWEDTRQSSGTVKEIWKWDGQAVHHRVCSSSFSRVKSRK